jgi:peptidoglycan/xylan/chitin deacetylase (PgdA/CDA1 family)
MIQVALRFDDPSAISDYALEREIIKILTKNRARATFAVIPKTKGQLVQANLLGHLLDAQAAGIVEIAQHGLTHAHHENISSPPSEFVGIDQCTQTSWIAEGKKTLENVFSAPIRGFIPPFNTFDQATANALEKLEFKYLSAGWEHFSPKISTLALLPRTCSAHELDDAIQEAQRLRGSDAIIVAVFHHYDFSEFSGSHAPLTLTAFDKLLEGLKSHSRVETLSLAALASRYSARTLLAAVKRRRLTRLLHWRTQNYLPRRYLTSRNLWSSLIRSKWLSNR